MEFRSDMNALLLGVLQSGPAHGYEIAKRVNALGEGTLKVGEAKLYPFLHRLEEEGLVVAEWIPQEGKPARKVYALTDRGIKALAEKRKAWSSFSDAVSRIIGEKAKVKRRG